MTDGASQLLAGKRAIITGGANPRGIGAAIAAQFLAQGATIAVLDYAYPDEADAALAGGRVNLHLSLIHI